MNKIIKPSFLSLVAAILATTIALHAQENSPDKTKKVIY